MIMRSLVFVLLFAVLALGAYASETNQNFSMTVESFGTQNLSVGNVTELRINVTNENLTANMTNYTVFVIWNGSHFYLNGTSPNYTAYNYSDAEFEWNFNLTNNSVATFEANLTFNGSQNSTIAVEIENGTGSLLYSINVSTSVPPMAPPAYFINKENISGNYTDGGNVTYQINVSNMGASAIENFTIYDFFNGSQLDYLVSNYSPENYTAQNVTWMVNLTAGQNFSFTITFDINDTGNITNRVLLYNGSTLEEDFNQTIFISGMDQGSQAANYTPLWSNAQAATLFADDYERFDFFGAPYVARGPGCYRNPSAADNHTVAGDNCCSLRNGSDFGDACMGSGEVDYDLGAVWVEESDDYLAWKIVGDYHKESNMSVCDAVNKSVAFVVEFDIDDNQMTGCLNPPYGNEGCYPGADYQIWFFPDDNTTLFAEYYNRTGNESSLPNGVAYRANASASANDTYVYYNCSVDESTAPIRERGLTIIINQTAVFGPNITPLLNFETNTFNVTEATSNPIDMLTDGGEIFNNFVIDGPGVDAGACWQWDHTNQSTCESNNESLNCIWTDFGGGNGLCDPDFDNFGAGVGCFEYNSSSTCGNDTQGFGNCQWLPGSFPTPDGLANGGAGICEQTFNPFELGAGDCDSDCFYCFTEGACNASISNGGQEWGGCEWYTDPLTTISFCEVKNLKFGCSENPFDCLDSTSCTAAGFAWNTTHNACLENVNDEYCFDAIDNNADGDVDCDDVQCQDSKSCGGFIDQLTGDFQGFSPEDALLQKLIPEQAEIHVIVEDNLSDGYNETTEIQNLMVVVSDLGVGIGIQVENTSDYANCGGSIEDRKFIYMIDTDTNASTGCNSTIQGVAHTGYEYLIKKGNFSVSENDTALEHYFYQCYNDTWAVRDQIVIQPVGGDPMLNQSIPLTCEAGADTDGGPQSGDDGTAAVVLEKIAIGNPTSDIRFSGFIINGSWDNLSNMSAWDSAADGYYTPGSVGFEPIDCEQEPTKCGTEFILIGGGEFFPFENCFDVGDEDLDGLQECADPDCFGAAQCIGQGGFNISNDITSPTVKGSQVDEFDIDAVVRWTTSEPTNGSVDFYYNTSCESLNATVLDEGIGGIEGDEFRSWHDVFLGMDTLGYDLTANTTYYYKLQSIDRANNTAISKCLNFTTLSAPDNVSLIINFTPPSGSAVFSNLSFEVDGVEFEPNNASEFNGSFQNVNLTFKNPDANSSANWSITLVGADFTNDAQIDFSSGFVENSSGDFPEAVGMNSLKWLNLVQKVGADYVIIQVPDPGDRLYHCADNGTSCQDITDEPGVVYLANQSTADFSVWQVPTTIGFSTYSGTTAGGITIETNTNNDSFSANGTAHTANFTVNSSGSSGVFNISVFNSTTNVTFSAVEYNNGTDWTSVPVNLTLNSTNVYDFRVNFTNGSYGAGLLNFTLEFTNATNASDATNVSSLFYTDAIVTDPINSTNNTPTINVSLVSLRATANATCELTINGTGYNNTVTLNASGEGEGRFNTSITGANTFYVECVRSGDVIGSNARAMTILGVGGDTEPPAITVNSPANSTLVSNVVTFNITLNETGSAWLSIDGGAINYTMESTDNLTFNYTNNSMADGGYTVTFYVNDSVSASNTNSTTRGFSIDTTAPTVTINDPANTTETSSSIVFNVTLNEAGSVMFSIDGGATNISMDSSDNLTFNYTNASVSDGAYVMEVFANDTVGNQNYTQNVSFSVDTTGPVITVNSPGAGYVYNITTVLFNVTLSETGTAWYSLDGGTTNVTMSTSDNLTFEATNSTITTGSYNVTFYANDSDGNNATAVTRGFSVDTVNPTLSIVSPASATLYNSTTVLLNVSSDGSTILYQINNGSFSSYSTIVNLTSLPQGQNNLTVNVNDSANNSNTSSISFTVDSVAPNVSSTLDNSTAGQIGVTINVSDVTSNISAIWYTLDGGSAVTINGSVGAQSYNNALNVTVTPGTHTLILYANDSATLITAVTNTTFVNGEVNLSTENTTIVSNIANSTAELTFSGNSTGVYNVSDLVNVSLGITLNQSTFVTLNFTGINGSDAIWNNSFTNATTSDPATSSSVSSNFSATTLALIKLEGQDNFLPDGSFDYASVLFGIDSTSFTTVYYFENETDLTYTAAEGVNACTSSNTSVFNASNIPCWINESGSTRVYVSGFSTIVVMNDTTAPTVVVDAPDASPESYFTPTINVSSDVDSCFLYDNTSSLNRTGTFNGTTCTFPIVSIATGTLGNFTLWVNDTAGNVNNTVYQEFTVSDATAPSITISAPSNNTQITDSTPTLSITLSENGTANYTINGGSAVACFTTAALSGSCTLASQSNGDYNITVFGYDINGNAANATINISISASSGSSGGGGGSSSSSGGDSSSAAIGGGTLSAVVLVEGTPIEKFISKGARREIDFGAGFDTHHINVTNIDVDAQQVTVVVESEPQTFVLGINDSVNVDVNTDGTYDLSMMLKSISASGSSAFLELTKITEVYDLGLGGDQDGAVDAAAASCTDGVQNQGEEGVDCGGPCAACQVQVDRIEDGPLADDTNHALAWVIAVLVLIVLAVGGVVLWKKRSAAAPAENSELQDYVDRQLAKGHTKEEVREALEEAGWDEETIEAVLAEESVESVLEDDKKK